MINRGLPTVVVVKIFGHSKPSVPKNKYAHCISNLRYKAANIMGEITTPIVFNIEKFQIHSQKLIKRLTIASKKTSVKYF